ncbi:MAG: C_GCAxxG_C_C family protein [Firmicutes bacterium]|nr:C_GCAxxG_C_C family protein [Candidatus Fiminaster equi]
MTRKELAMKYFEEGYNCSQAVVLAFADLIPNSNELVKIAAPFGGGMARMRETCGAVSGMVLVVGSLYGYSTPETGDKKLELYAMTQPLLKKFEEKYGSLTCRVLRGLMQVHDDPTPTKRDTNFYKTRPCKELVGGAAEILDEFISSKKN